MKDLPEKKDTDWSKVSEALQKSTGRADLPFHPDQPLQTPAGLMPPAPDESRAQLDGIIANFKAKKLQQRAALEQLETWYNKSLEVQKHRLSEVAKVRKAEASLIAEQFLQRLDAMHIEYLTKLGLRNEQVRNEAFIALADQTSAALKQIGGKDWPAELIQETIDGVYDRHRRFFRKLLEDLGAAK